jgi:predicted alpha/beta superfamily hydrolase
MAHLSGVVPPLLAAFAVACVPVPPPPSATALASAPPYTLPNTQVRTLPRSVDGRDYILYVALPASYQREPQKRYPVLYLCDGYWDFALVRGFYGNLVYDRVVPELILVGFGYPGHSPDFEALRAHDYTPEPLPDRDSGHAPEFLTTIEHQIIPFVEASYRADPGYRVLAGSSLGGLFTLYALFTNPELFQGYIAPSPAVNWASSWLFSYESQFAEKHPSLQARLFVTGAGAEAPDFLAAIQRFDAQVKQHAYKGLTYEFRLVEGERHAGTKAESYNRGVRFAFAPRAEDR